MAWHGDQIERIAGSEELHITTTRPDGTQRRWTPIWVVRVGDALFVRSAAGDRSDWYRHAMQHNQARVRADGVEANVQLHLVDDPAIVDQVTEAYRIKYRNQGSLLPQFLRPPATGATLQLEA
jgi:hypothetical protein